MGTGFWIILAVLAILLFATGKPKNNGKSSGTQDRTHRIDHLHYIDLDEYECPKCHTVFKKNTMVCPNCGLCFTGTQKDMTAYDDELEEELEMDEWDEEEN